MLVQELGMSSGRDMEVSWEIWNGTYLGDMEGRLVGKFGWTPDGRSRSMVGWNF